MFQTNTRFIAGGVILFSVVVFDFISNAYVSLDSNKSLLQIDNVEPWSEKSADSQTLPSINALFGMKPDVPKAQQESEQAIAERERLEREKLEKEREERERQQLLSVGEDNIRLFGISRSGSGNSAWMSLNLLDENGRVFLVKEGETFSVADEKIELTITTVNQNSVDLLINNKVSESRETFKLVMFEYEM